MASKYSDKNIITVVGTTIFSPAVVLLPGNNVLPYNWNYWKADSAFRADNDIGIAKIVLKVIARLLAFIFPLVGIGFLWFMVSYDLDKEKKKFKHDMRLALGISGVILYFVICALFILSGGTTWWFDD